MKQKFYFCSEMQYIKYKKMWKFGGIAMHSALENANLKRKEMLF